MPWRGHQQPMWMRPPTSPQLLMRSEGLRVAWCMAVAAWLFSVCPIVRIYKSSLGMAQHSSKLTFRLAAWLQGIKAAVGFTNGMSHWHT